MLKDIDLKYDLALDMYFALLKIPLHEERFKQDKYIVNYIASTIRNAASKIRRNNIKHHCDSIEDIE